MAIRLRAAFPLVATSLLLSACQFDSSGVSVDRHDGGAPAGDQDGSRPPTDGRSPDGGDIAHLDPALWYGGAVDLILVAGDEMLVDTSELSLEGDGWDGLELSLATQQLPGPDVAILRVDRIELAQGAVLRASGSRPLIIIATDRAEINGTVTASANLNRPGAGGFAPAAGPGAGGGGEHKGFRDGGGGGGGFGDDGAPGGTAFFNGLDGAKGGTGGTDYLDHFIAVLVGGSGGGRDGLPCSDPPGAGGGAVQLTSYSSIAIGATGVIEAGGGGGGAGSQCPVGSGTAYGGGAGGGAGGAIYLQAPTIAVVGSLAANGGGGGGGAGADGIGDAGEGGGVAAPANGGDRGGELSSDGGQGSFASDGAGPGADLDLGNGNTGGGGGGSGRIVVSTRDAAPVLAGGFVSPDPAILSY